VNTISKIEAALLGIGYSADALLRDYQFADVLTNDGVTCGVELAAFTQIPASFRTAAFGVIVGSDDPQAAVRARRALGAPVFFSVDSESVGVWSVEATTGPRLLERVAVEKLESLFARYHDRWSPQALHRAKAFQFHERETQFDFIDLGLLTAIEKEVRTKLHDVMADVVSILLPDQQDQDAEKVAFRVTFRLLAAKILADRDHPSSLIWRDQSVGNVINGIEDYYGLSKLSASTGPAPVEKSQAAWERLKSAISLRNISADSLAFVYENTLVTADTRKLFGTHSTPQTVAEYIVSQIDFKRFDLERLRIVEPFTGAGIFLVAALQHLRDVLPREWSPAQRHAFLIERMHGAELDVFACEVATLSLILADYPNANGWHIRPCDLFTKGSLETLLEGATVIFCNPPFEDFSQDERQEYPDAFANSASKASVALNAAIDASPEALGFVLPRGFLQQSRYRRLRERLAERYGRIELVSLPDRVFEKATYPCSLVIAGDRRESGLSHTVRLTSKVVKDQDRSQFMSSRLVSSENHSIRSAASGELWVGALDGIWDYLADRPRLGDHADVYRGLQWRIQREGVYNEPGPLLKRGVYLPADSLRPFQLFNPVWLSIDPAVNLRPAPLSRAWSEPKVLINNQRRSRGPWRLSAAADRTGLLASQQFTGIWPHGRFNVECLVAILNGPLASAYVTEHSTDHDFTNVMIQALPLPAELDRLRLQEAVRIYEELLKQKVESLLAADIDAHLNRALLEIDAIVLQGYDLPPRLERKLLNYFGGAKRPTPHPFDGWLPHDFRGFVPLHEWLTSSQEKNRGTWVLDIFTPASSAENDAVNWFLN
jgi:hypothetical protein